MRLGKLLYKANTEDDMKNKKAIEDIHYLYYHEKIA